MNEATAMGLLVACFGMLAAAELWSCRGRVRRDQDTPGRAVTNFGLGIGVLVVSALPLLSCLGASSLGANYGVGLAHGRALAWPTVFVLTLGAQSLTAYWVHRLMHAAPLLWRVHRVHHADAHLDVSTGLRNHPLELLVTLPAGAAVVLLIGAPPSAVVAVEAILFAAALWQHSDFVLPATLERWLGRLFVTPAFHRVHHLPDRRRHDGNYGDIVILWDRLFGTARGTASRDDRVGLDRQRARPDSLIDQLVGPFVRDREDEKSLTSPQG